jgi:hypothetical protein
VIVRFVDVGEIVDHHCLSFFFNIGNDKETTFQNSYVQLQGWENLIPIF